MSPSNCRAPAIESLACCRERTKQDSSHATSGASWMANPGVQQCRTALRCKFRPQRPGKDLQRPGKQMRSTPYRILALATTAKQGQFNAKNAPLE